ncbi:MULTISPECIES: tautomerase family protein [unclassified Polynucleobacter]|jgi:phenylpyruvate tautomerase PptA (4-oxalocrotonate tautomerase family)|uniref:tautomerase family protein n=1 Tax=unclassified Polynucleobacter TaxID=2640945 RepID=UPI001BFED854|nr:MULTISPECIES: tautomerase family protein [unclassified Polynucleobacter]MBU3606687.1 4-oxalocrotonate tautomerase [Polynucleobacter sp. MWH-Creno-3A4]QWD77243.1 4-oxalocrotonate tautomerase [Polynucleobacter sp. MWH-Svant-W18]
MATYSVYYAGLNLSTHQKYTIAQAITKIHAEVTGAEAYFAQVIFKELDIHDCFIGGVLLEDAHIFVNGQIRAGRSEQIKKQLLVEIEIAIQSTTKLASNQIWAYIDELSPNQMIEYGQILPAVGHDGVWFATLPANIQEKLSYINS